MKDVYYDDSRDLYIRRNGTSFTPVSRDGELYRRSQLPESQQKSEQEIDYQMAVETIRDIVR